MWPFNKKKVIPAGQAAPPPTHRNAVMEIILVNNNTDKEYVVKSENDFGLTWEHLNSGLLLMRQRLSLGNDKWKVIGQYQGFSMVKITHQTFKL